MTRVTKSRAQKTGAETHGLGDEQLLELYRFMLLNRSFDDRVGLLYRQGKIVGGAFASRGQEATTVGSAYALGPDDVIGPMIRNSGAFLVRGMEPARYLANYLGRATGPTRGRDGNTHMGDLSLGIFAPISMLGALIPVMAGAALAFKRRGEPRVALTWIGDGGASMGDFHEGLNFAATAGLPLVLILENNQYAYSTPVERQCANTRFADRALGYGIPGIQVDGNDVLEVYRVTRESVERARGGGGPTLIESVTMRMKGHAEHDDFSYVPRELLAEWEKKDPIACYEVQLEKWGLLDEKRKAALREEVQQIVESAEAEALEAPYPDPATVEEGLHA